MKISIIGAGPVGSYTAYLLSKKGYTVNLYEEHKKVGQPIQCTGILTNTIKEIIPIKKEIINNKINNIKLISPNQTETTLRLRNPELIINRHLFDKTLYNKAIDTGTISNLNTRYMGKKKGEITLKKSNKITSTKTKIIIGADGPSSKVRQNITTQEMNHYIGIQALVKIEKPIDTYEVHFSNEISPEFFAWIVPESQKICRIGLAVKKDPNKHFQKFLSKQKIKKEQIITYQGGLIPIYNPKLTLKKDDTYIIGDAAAQVKATTGGGIIPGLKAGGILVKSIEEKTSYEKNLKELNNELKTHLAIRRLMNNFSDKNYDSLIRDLSKKQLKTQLENTTRDNLSKQLIRILIKNPSLIKYAPTLLRKSKRQK